MRLAQQKGIDEGRVKEKRNRSGKGKKVSYKSFKLVNFSKIVAGRVSRLLLCGGHPFKRRLVK